MTAFKPNPFEEAHPSANCHHPLLLLFVNNSDANSDGSFLSPVNLDVVVLVALRLCRGTEHAAEGRTLRLVGRWVMWVRLSWELNGKALLGECRIAAIVRNLVSLLPMPDYDFVMYSENWV